VPLVWLCAAAFAAGCVDAVVGGGGLLQVPALLLWLPGPDRAVATVLGTNKLASIVGTATAAAQYAARIPIRWRTMLPSAATAFVFAMGGAMAVARLRGEILEPIVLLLLVVVTTYTAVRPRLGDVHAPALRPRHEQVIGVLIGAALGFYDGFFGPGTGSFLIFAFIGLFGFDFLTASASAKLINFSTNLAALLFFASAGHVNYRAGLPMAACQIAGSIVGTRTALRRGNRFVRVFFLIVAAALIARVGWQTLTEP
jgi:uncharacterized membrane protein YfcA